MEVPGRHLDILNCDGKGDLVHSVFVDEEYSAITLHIDKAFKKKIILGEYVDLAKLLPREKLVTLEDEQRMETAGVCLFGCH